MQRFVPIQARPGVRVVISEKFVEIFDWYEGDLDQVQRIYEAHKHAPPAERNAPPVAGAVAWARHLLRRIEEPMKTFSDNRAITALKDFSRVVRIYNKLATALVTFENLWLKHWQAQIEAARDGLKATLFVAHPVTKKIVVNADEKVPEDDMQGTYTEFVKLNPEAGALQREVARLLEVEARVLAIPAELAVGVIVLRTEPVRNALHCFACAWKTLYGTRLHEEAKRHLDAAVAYRLSVKARLELPVLNLDQLNATLHLLEEIADMENKVDEVYLPVENMYGKLREFDLRLPREQVEQVDALRAHWA